ncbi:hypothetical protein SK128_021590 [Halocaridina rubra]|uniref:Carboxylic ester hydrolase n=1 Tax=Halocaridina rubra TaxID=373956 RepID=A0AAN8XCX0_HALRR
MRLEWFLLTTVIGTVFSVTPPLSSIPESLWKYKEDLLQQPTNFVFNLGLQGAVTQDDWDRATLADVEPPVLLHPNLNGHTKPVTVTGKYMRTIKNRTICAFQGIRFAEPPVAEKRFKKPEPAKPYFPEDKLLANHLGEKCPQGAMFGPVGSGSEDCLNLNVYTPYLPDALPNGEKLPVMMWIHGGGFTGGDSSLYLPTKLLDHDVMLVVIHYRLGSLGFFSLQSNEAPGNAGLWDQIEALKWIRDNIDGFGGDKTRVTIFGESAGSASVTWLHLLPEAKGLFHGIIGESGSSLEYWGLDPEPLVSGLLVAGINGCPNDTDTPVAEIFDCMKDVPADDIALNLNHFLGEDRKRGEMGFRGAAPVIDNFPGATTPLISKPAEEYYMDGEGNNVPLIIGANKQEGSFVLASKFPAMPRYGI